MWAHARAEEHIVDGGCVEKATVPPLCYLASALLTTALAKVDNRTIRIRIAQHSEPQAHDSVVCVLAVSCHDNIIIICGTIYD